MRNVRVFETDLSGVANRIFSTLGRKGRLAVGAENRMAAKMREQLRDILRQVVLDARTDGSLPYRTGRSFRTMLGGARAFGTRFSNIRGHIIGPGYIKLMEEGGTIYPTQASALSIPLEAALRPDGTPKLPGPRSWQNILKTFIYKSKNTGRLYIAYKGANGRLTLLYLLVDEAEFQSRRFLRKAWQQRTDDLMRAFGSILLEEFDRVDLLALARVTTKGKGRRR